MKRLVHHHRKNSYGVSNSVVLREPERSILKYVSTGSLEKPRRLAARASFNNASRPVSRVLYGRSFLQRGGHSSCADVAIRLMQPTRTLSPGKGCARFPPHAVSLFGFAPGGVYRAASRYRPRGGLLPHRFTLTCYINRRFLFCGTFPGVAPAGR